MSVEAPRRAVETDQARILRSAIGVTSPLSLAVQLRHLDHNRKREILNLLLRHRVKRDRGAILCYNSHTLSDSPSNPTTPKCNQCGSDLILLNEKIERLGLSLSPVTTTTYRCSNIACQEEIDRRVSKRLELRAEREQARQNRLQAHIKPTAE